MLCLGRKTGESFMVGDNVKVTVLSIRGMIVRVGIQAPPEMKVLRQELWDEDQ